MIDSDLCARGTQAHRERARPLGLDRRRHHPYLSTPRVKCHRGALLKPTGRPIANGGGASSSVTPSISSPTEAEAVAVAPASVMVQSVKRRVKKSASSATDGKVPARRKKKDDVTFAS